ncbi:MULTISPECIES: glycosyltransferase family 39 protein [unclassified Streptomyces]|uniref:glycosyltransferase family 39 protein n=1 Tax=unclassified Streptomyces TaxID=2593676 RepID=UPI00278C726B|nr:MULTISPECIES: glycosyltransferase family 39 protein [unclassified Streptomyces]
MGDQKGPRRDRGPAPWVARWGVCLGPALLSLGLGLWGLTRHDSMWRDESVTYQMAHRDAGDIWRTAGHIDAVHGAYYGLMRLVFSGWEGGLVALRLPSVLATAVAAGLVALLATRMCGPRAGLLAGAAFALTPLVRFYAQEGRSYAIVCACVVAATYAYVRAVQGGGARWWVAYGGLLVGAVVLHEFAVLVLMAHGVSLWLGGVGYARVAWGRCVAGVLLVVAPLAVLSARQSGAQLVWLGRPSGAEWAVHVGACGAGVLLFRLAGGRRREFSAVAVALPLLAVPGGLLLVVSLVKPYYVDRYVLYGWVGLALLIGAGADRLIGAVPAVRRDAARDLAALAVVAAIGAVPWLGSPPARSPESRLDDVVAISRAVREVARPGDAVLYLPARRREWAMSYPRQYGALRDVALARTPVASGTLQGEEASAARIRRALEREPRVVALMDPAGQPLDAVDREAVKRSVLRDRFQRCRVLAVHGARVALYARPGHCPPHRSGTLPRDPHLP